MISPAIPLNDDARVKALHALGILDTPTEERFERLTQIAMTALQTPMASVSLIDRHRQWCKSSPGMGTGEAERSMSFCGHTILQKEPMVINDTLEDPRFFDNPVVTNSPHVRAYVGIPFFSMDGHCVGSFCVVDTRPRQFTPDQIKMMESLAAVVQNEITNFALNDSLNEARAARGAAEAADMAKSQFLAVMSHEIRTPLNGMIGITDLLAETELNEIQREYVQIVLSSGNALLALINDVLDFSKIEAGKLELEYNPIEIRRFLKETLAIHFHAAKAKGIDLSNRIGDVVPIAVLGDMFRLRQVLLNLVSNALKFTREGEIEVRIDLEHESSPEPFLLFSVRDTGPGLTPEGQARLFQAFSQADSSVSRTHGGTGLGLSVCKQLVELMGGRIWVESKLGEGSKFAFAIPLLQSDLAGDSADPATSAAKTSGADTPDYQNLKVLVVDDDNVNQRVAKLLLGRLGCQAESVSSGAACLAEMKNNFYPLILMDMEMPEMSGCETSFQIHTDYWSSERKTARPWIVALTGNVGKDIAIQCSEAGMNDYLTKPLRLGPLRVALERYRFSLES